jgi:hypothetical protein
MTIIFEIILFNVFLKKIILKTGSLQENKLTATNYFCKIFVKNINFYRRLMGYGLIAFNDEPFH